MSNDILSLIGNLQEMFQGLNRDTDPNDAQDNTRENLRGVTQNFDQIQTILQNMNKSDFTAIIQEYNDIFSGRESLSKNLSDIRNIIDHIRRRAQQNPQIKQQLQKNLPSEKKNEDVEALLNRYQSLAKEMQALEEKMQALR